VPRRHLLPWLLVVLETADSELHHRHRHHPAEEEASTLEAVAMPAELRDVVADELSGLVAPPDKRFIELLYLYRV